MKVAALDGPPSLKAPLFKLGLESAPCGWVEQNTEWGMVSPGPGLTIPALDKHRSIFYNVHFK